MKLTKERTVEILKDNFEISMLYDCFPEESIWFDFLSEPKDGIECIDVNIVIDTTWESIVPLEVDIMNYDEKFSDINKYEVIDMGLNIRILNTDGNTEELTGENIWKALFYNKENKS